MARWIVFNQLDAEVATAAHARPEFRTGDPLLAALDAERSVILLPAGRGQVLVGEVLRRILPRTQPQPAQPLDVARWEDADAIGYQAGGMLGLLDLPIYHEEKPRKWWQRVLD
jgi:hypothetical protein